MSTSSAAPDRRAWWAAACAVALATTVGTPATSTAREASESLAIGKLERYCTTSWRNAGLPEDEWEDCTQQAIVELLEEVSPDGLAVALDDCQSPQRRELNRAVWRQTQRCRRAARLHHLDDRNVPTDLRRRDDGTAQQRWEEVRTVASNLLSRRQLLILDRLREGWRTSEIAKDLGIPPARVSDEKYKAIAKLREGLET